MEAIEELNKIKVRFVFEDEVASQARKRRATITRSRDSTCSDIIVQQVQQPSSSSPSSQQQQSVSSSTVTKVDSTHASRLHNHHLGGYNSHPIRPALAPIPNERIMIQTELIDRLEKMTGMADISNQIASHQTYNNNVGDDGPRLGIYNQEERIQRINAYREKRKQRVFGKVRYVLRQRASEGRSRVKGRFAKEESNASMPTSNTSQTESTAGDDEMKESVSWLEKMTLTARRLSGSFSMKRPSGTSPSHNGDDGTGASPADVSRSASWSSWLLKSASRRKSSSSTVHSNRTNDALMKGDGGGSGVFLPPVGQTPPLPHRISSAHQLVPATMITLDDEARTTDEFFIEQLGEPDRKRLTSGSSALFNEFVMESLANDDSLI